MPVEALQRPEIDSFTHTWRGKGQQQVAEELASYSLETKRIPDPYYFLVNANGELISPSAHCKVKDVVQRTQPVGELEYQALLRIEQWAKTSSEGVVAWVSPPYPGIYPNSKIIISEIEYKDGIKQLFNRALILDFGEEKCLKFAQDLANDSQNRPLLCHLDEVRSTPIILNTKETPWIHFFEELIDDPASWKSIRRGEDIRAKEQALIQARIIHHSLYDKNIPVEDAEIMIKRILGSQTGSCPVLFNKQKETAFQVFAGASLLVGVSSSLESDEDGSLIFECHKCHKPNDRPRGGRRPSCKHCGVIFGGC